MNEFQIALAIGLGVALYISRGLPRATLWLILGAASFIASTAYWRWGFPYPQWFSLLCDAAIVLCIYHRYEEPWENKLRRIFQAMVLVNILYMAGIIGPHYAVILCLEILNWAAMALITWTAVRQGVSADADASDHSGRADLHPARISLRGQREFPPWHKVKR